jgi:hypothetical protein
VADIEDDSAVLVVTGANLCRQNQRGALPVLRFER